LNGYTQLEGDNMVVLDIPRSHDVGFRSFKFSQQPNEGFGFGVV
jgi:hypothetical protein